MHHRASSPVGRTLAICFAVLALFAQTPSRAAQAADRGTACAGAGEFNWTAAERAIWQNVCARRSTDFSGRSDRAVSARFLETILTKEPYRDAIHAPVAMAYARFADPIDLSYTTIDAPLSLTNCDFAATVNMSGIQARYISLSGSTVDGAINLADSQVQQSVVLSGTRVVDGISLARARVGVNVEMDDSRTGAPSPRLRDIAKTRDDAARGPVDLDSVDARSVHMRGVRFGDVNLSLAHLAGQLAMDGATTGSISLDAAHVAGQFSLHHATTGSVNADNATIDGPAFLTGGEYKDVDLSGAKLGASITIANSDIRKLLLRTASVGSYAWLNAVNLTGDCVCDQLQLAGSLALDETTIGGSANFQYLNAIGSFRISGGNFGRLDLGGAKVGDLIVSSGAKKIWRDDGTFILRNTTVHAFEDRSTECPAVGDHCTDPWPPAVDANGFTYQQLGALSAHIQAATGAASSESAQQLEHLEDATWWHKWLSKAQYSPERYAQAASILRQSGHPEAATQVLFDGKDHEYDNLPAGIKKFILFLSRSSIGYGYYPGRAVWFVLAFLVLGVVVLWRSPERRRLESVRPANTGPVFPLWGLVYSFDMLIPVLTLRKANEDIELKGRSRVYFYVHRTIGFLLATFLLAGLTGLTK